MTPTGSRLYLARVCPSSFALPHLDLRTDAADAGIAHHAEKEVAINDGRIPDALAERWPGLKWYAEVAYAFDVLSGKGRILGYGLNRDYSGATDAEVCGTADAVGISDATLVVVDFKSYAEVERAAVNAQLHLGSAALASHYGRDAATVAVHYEARPMDVAELDAFDLEAFAGDVATILRGVELARIQHEQGGELTFVEGSHCRYCPAFSACPKKQQLAAIVGTRIEQAATGKLLFALDDDAEAARVYLFAEQVAQLLGNLRAALVMRAKERPIPLSSGKLYGPVQKKGNDKLDPDKLYELVRAKYGQGIADAAVVRSATKKRLGEALDFAGVKSKAAAERELLGELRKQGGIENKPTVAVEEYDPPARQLKAVNE